MIINQILYCTSSTLCSLPGILTSIQTHQDTKENIHTILMNIQVGKISINPGRWGMEHRNHYFGYGRVISNNVLLKEFFIRAHMTFRFCASENKMKIKKCPTKKM